MRQLRRHAKAAPRPPSPAASTWTLQSLTDHSPHMSEAGGGATLRRASSDGNDKRAARGWARREHHCPWDSLTPETAASGGHLEVLQWAREHACPWDSATCFNAADHGQLEVLQWVRENDATARCGT